MFAQGLQPLAPAPMLCPMFIRRTRTRTGERGEVYYSHRLVRSERNGEKVRQRTLLNLGSDFPVERRALGGAVQPDAAASRPPGRAGSAELSGRGRAPCPAHRRAAAQQRPVRRGRASRPADGGCRLPGADPPALGGGRACRSVGDGGAWPGRASGAAGLQRHAARARHGQRHRPHGRARSAPAGAGCASVRPSASFWAWTSSA